MIVPLFVQTRKTSDQNVFPDSREKSNFLHELGPSRDVPIMDSLQEIARARSGVNLYAVVPALDSFASVLITVYVGRVWRGDH